MNQPAPFHATFSIERDFRAPRDMVFGAWTDSDAKAQWFIAPGNWREEKRTLDARVGGRDVLQGTFESGVRSLYEARYHVVRASELLVYVYDMYIDDEHLSTSLSTVEFRAAGGGTRMIYTEQSVYYDGEDGSNSRKNGVGAHFDHLADHLAREVAA